METLFISTSIVIIILFIILITFVLLSIASFVYIRNNTYTYNNTNNFGDLITIVYHGSELHKIIPESKVIALTDEEINTIVFVDNELKTKNINNKKKVDKIKEQKETEKFDNNTFNNGITTTWTMLLK